MNKDILLIGRGTIAVNCLNILKKTNNLPRIIICDSKDSGMDSWAKSLFKRALALGYKENINLFRESKVNKPEFISQLQQLPFKIDIILSVQPRAIFRKQFINLARDYVINLHLAPLPKLRGVAPCSWAIIDNLKIMGVTLHLIDNEGIDNGPIVAQVKFPINNNDTSWSLFNKCIKQGTKLFNENITNILKMKVNRRKQNENEATYHPMGEMDFSQLKINRKQSLDSAFNFTRSRIFPPYQLPYFIYSGKKVKIKMVRKISRRISKKTEYLNGKYYIPFSSGTLIAIPDNTKDLKNE
jgi:methionyl-tRNA formyltransferase